MHWNSITVDWCQSCQITSPGWPNIIHSSLLKPHYKMIRPEWCTSFCKSCYTEKKIWYRVDCQHSEKRSKTHKRLKRTFFNWTKQANFQGSPLFQAAYNIKTEKQTSYSLSSCQLDAGRLAEGKGHVIDCPLPCVSLVPFSDFPSASLPASNWHKLTE